MEIFTKKRRTILYKNENPVQTYGTYVLLLISIAINVHPAKLISPFIDHKGYHQPSHFYESFIIPSHDPNICTRRFVIRYSMHLRANSSQSGTFIRNVKSHTRYHKTVFIQMQYSYS